MCKGNEEVVDEMRVFALVRGGMTDVDNDAGGGAIECSGIWAEGSLELLMSMSVSSIIVELMSSSPVGKLVDGRCDSVVPARERVVVGGRSLSELSDMDSDDNDGSGCIVI